MVLRYKPIILFLQESKLRVFDSRIIRILGGNFLSRGVGVEADRSAGGLITLWNEELFSVKSCITTSRSIILIGALVGVQQEVTFCNVYAANIEGERKELWKYVVEVQNSFPIPWCIGGDFNTVLSPDERRGRGCDMVSIRNFNDFVLRAKVMDLPLDGMPFTWTNSRVSAAWARLDRFLVSPEFLLWFPHLVQRGLPRSVSDHNAIILGEKVVDWGPKPFRFFNGWLEDKRVMSEAIKGWKNCKVEGSKGFTLAAKVRGAKGFMKRWCAVNRGAVSVSKRLEGSLAAVDELASLRGWSEDLRKERMVLLSSLWMELRKEEQLWRQKARITWLNSGDKNSRFFHCVASGRKKGNLISELVFDGVKISDPTLLKEGILEFFKNHYSNVKWSRPKIKGLGLKKLADGERLMLEDRFKEEEVWEAVCNCDGNKAPGPDGLNLNFIKANWGVIRMDFMQFIQEFYDDGKIVRDLNKTFITLIPKCGHPETVRDFRPISLVSSMYKILAKVLANRLKKVMDSVIGENQMAFVANRQIMDSFVVAEEIIHKWRKDKVGGLLVKLDFEKAYDSVDHSFLDFIMEEMGFGCRWRQWMKWCIATPSISVLVNRSPTAEFSMERGLRQGDPLSPFLFNLVVESLSGCFKKATGLGLVRGVVFGEGEVQVTHLQYVDDTILFLEPKVEYIVNFRRILRCFEVASGLRINFHKSCVVRVGKPRGGESEWADIFKCKKASFPILYLGMPLGARPSYRMTIIE
ncbi:hypothetical protein LWI29_016836 [Acer saccharum]|uniref:Reverse transcriptase domain-containing protein n=1 Tax=Acer saccharum TaxID=4024 RepID=A0AA39TMQ0_ACESA|nr:hypothetical protein LWI29_016836 [Acer saccharum]